MKLVKILLLFIFVVPTANAGPFTDKLSICLVQQTNEADKEILIKWVFAAMSSHPNVQHLSNVSSKTGEKLNKNTAELFVDLISNRCEKEAREAIKYENEIALNKSFEVLGKVAMQGIMGNPNVSAYMGGMEKYIDANKLRSVFPQ